MALSSPAPTAWGRGLRGFAEGALLTAVAVAFVELVSGRGLRAGWPMVLAAAGAGGVVFAVGRAVAASAVGSFFGAFAGALAGVLVGSLFNWNYAYEVPEPDRPDEPQPGEVLDFRGPTLDGQEFDLKKLRGKVVLVDFWATWCPPCVAEMPHLKAAYDKYHKDGFEVVGVSLDWKRAPLEAFVERQGLPWPQVFFDEAGKRGSDNPVAVRHNIRYLPTTFLLDREGRIAARNPGEDLEKEVARLLGKGDADEGRGVPKHYRLVPLGIYTGLGVGLLLGGVAGAFVERRLRPPPSSTP